MRGKEKKLWVIGSVIALLFPLVLFSLNTAFAQKGDTIKIGCVFELSGFLAADGNASFGAVKLWQKEVNASGGILGKRVELIVEDSASDPKTGNEKMKKILPQKPDVFTGPMMSGMRTACYPVAVNAGIPFLYFTFYEGGAYHPLMFINGETPEQQAEPFVPYLIKNYGLKFYIVGSDYEFPQKSSRVCQYYLKKFGGTPLGTEMIAFGTTDFSSVITRIRKAKPDVLYSIMVGADAAAFSKQFHDYGLKKEMQYASIVDMEVYVDAMGKEASEGNLASFAWFQNVDKPKAKEFVKKYKEVEPRLRVTTEAESCYSLLLLWTKAVKKAGTTEGQAVRKAIAGLSVEAPEGTLTLRAKDNHCARPIYIAKVHNGEYEVVKEFPKIEPGEDQQKPKW